MDRAGPDDECCTPANCLRIRLRAVSTKTAFARQGGLFRNPYAATRTQVVTLSPKESWRNNLVIMSPQPLGQGSFYTAPHYGGCDRWLTSTSSTTHAATGPGRKHPCLQCLLLLEEPMPADWGQMIQMSGGKKTPRMVKSTAAQQVCCTPLLRTRDDAQQKGAVERRKQVMVAATHVMYNKRVGVWKLLGSTTLLPRQASTVPPTKTPHLLPSSECWCNHSMQNGICGKAHAAHASTAG